MKKLFLCAALLTANWCTYGADSSRSVAKFTDDTICRFSNHTCYVEAMLQLIEERTKAGKPFPSQIRIKYDQYVEKKSLRQSLVRKNGYKSAKILMIFMEN